MSRHRHQEISAPPPALGATVLLGVGCLTVVYAVHLLVLLALARHEHSLGSGLGYPALARSGLYFALAVTAGSLAGGVCVLLYCKLARKRWLRQDLALRMASGRDWLLWLGVMITASAALFALGRLLGRPLVNETVAHAYQTARVMSLFWVAMVLAAPVFEELLFRGLLFSAIAGSRLGRLGAVAFTAVSWAAIHTQYDAFDLGVVLVLGGVLGAARACADSLYLCVGLHALFNLSALVACALLL